MPQIGKKAELLQRRALPQCSIGGPRGRGTEDRGAPFSTATYRVFRNLGKIWFFEAAERKQAFVRQEGRLTHRWVSLWKVEADRLIFSAGVVCSSLIHCSVLGTCHGSQSLLHSEGAVPCSWDKPSSPSSCKKPLLECLSRLLSCVQFSVLWSG